MKNIILVIMSCMLMVWFTSCEEMMGDFLEKPPGVDVTEDTIFSSRTQAETFLASIYEYGIHSNLPYKRQNAPAHNEYSLPAGATDEGETCGYWYHTQWWNEGTISPDRPDDFRWNYRWTAIRKISVFLDRIDDVPDLDPAYLKQLKAEVKFIRALNYCEMFKHYGGVPIIDQRIQLTDELKIPRSTLEEVVNFIVKDCDEAAADLPSSYPANLRGRATKGAALALKARTLLYAASPQFNTDTPYLDFGVNNNLICFGNTDATRWQKAADAAKAVIDWARGAGCYLITDKGVTKNYRYYWQVYDNAEIILAEKSQPAQPYHPGWGSHTTPWTEIAPNSIYPSNAGIGGISPTLNFVKKYEKSDGTPQTWNPDGGSDLQAKMAELDPRFHQTIAYNMSRWDEMFPQVQIYQGGRDANLCFGGFWLRKLYPETRPAPAIPNSTLFGLAEQYLNYAEALNEAQGPVQAAYDAVNTIRRRSGMPDLPAGLSKEQFRERVRNERAIELSFEGFRFWDIRRWLIAENEGVMKGNMYGIKIYKIDGSTEFRYEPYVFETRTWTRKMYLHPFSTNEINKGYLVQNPGY